MLIKIPASCFDSLADWSSVDDIIDTHPYLTLQQARLACNFHSVNSLDAQASILFNIIDSMVKYSLISYNQVNFIAELAEFRPELKLELIDAVNRISKSKNTEICLELMQL